MRYLLILFTLFTVTACSYSPDHMQSAYNNMTGNYAKELKQMADFSAEEKDSIDGFANDLQQWHRQHRLPSYAHVLSNLAEQLDQSSKASPGSVKALLMLVNGYPHFHESTKSHQQLAVLAQEMADEQAEQVLSSLQDSIDELKDELEGLSKQQMERRLANGINEIMDYLGVELSKKQLDLIRQHAGGFHDQRHDIVTAYGEWFDVLEKLLKHRHKPEFVDQFVTHMQYDNEYRLLLKHAPVQTRDNDQKAIVMLQALFDSLDGEQRTNLVKNLRSMSETLLTL
jgi:uncharacterized protein YukE